MMIAWSSRKPTPTNRYSTWCRTILAKIHFSDLFCLDYNNTWDFLPSLAWLFFTAQTYHQPESRRKADCSGDPGCRLMGAQTVCLTNRCRGGCQGLLTRGIRFGMRRILLTISII